MRFLNYSKFINSNCFSKIFKFLGTWTIILFFTYHYFTAKKTDLAIPYPQAEVQYQQAEVQHLQAEVQYPQAEVQFNTSQIYLSSNLASWCDLGNHIFEFASLYGLSQRLNRTPVFFIENDLHKRMLEKTKKVMPGLVEKFMVINGKVPDSIRPTPFQKHCCSYYNPKKLERIEDEYLHLTGMFYQSWKYFPEMREELIGYLNPLETSNFGNLPKSEKNTHITCIHARRGDFLRLEIYGADPVFIRNALEFINEQSLVNDTKEYRKVVLFGDDVKFMENVFQGAVLSTDEQTEATYYISKNSPADDFMYSKYNCDVVLISAPHSTFGWWIGYFSKGNKVYHMDIRYTNDTTYNIKDFYRPHWTSLKFASSDNFTVVESLE